MKFTCVICLLLAIHLPAFSQINWDRAYHDSCAVMEAFEYEEGYVGIGHYTNVLGGKQYYYYLRTNYYGDTIAERLFQDSSSSNFHGGYSGIEGPGKSILVAGFANVQSGVWELRLLQIDSLANIQWIKTYPNTDGNGNHCRLIATPDSGYAIFGEANYSGYFIKTDASGNQLFRKDYGMNYMYVSDAMPNPDGTYALCGYTQQISQAFNGFVMHVDSAGNIIWARQLFSNDEPLCFAVDRIQDHYYVSVKDRLTDDMYISRFDLAGNNQVDFPINHKGGMGKLSHDNNLNLIGCGYVNQGSVDSAIFMVLDTNGTVLMERKWQSNRLDNLRTCFQGSGGEYVVGGESDIKSFMARVDPNGSNSRPDELPCRLHLYPNPLPGTTLKVTMAQPIVRVKVYDLTGNPVHGLALGYFVTELQLELPDRPGTYLLRIDLADGTVLTRKVIKL